MDCSVGRKKGLSGEFKLPRPSEGGKAQRTVESSKSPVSFKKVCCGGQKLWAGAAWDLEQREGVYGPEHPVGTLICYRFIWVRSEQVVPLPEVGSCRSKHMKEVVAFPDEHKPASRGSWGIPGESFCLSSSNLSVNLLRDQPEQTPRLSSMILSAAPPFWRSTFDLTWKTWVWFTAPTLGCSQPPVTPAPERFDTSGFCRHLHSGARS